VNRQQRQQQRKVSGHAVRTLTAHAQAVRARLRAVEALTAEQAEHLAALVDEYVDALATTLEQDKACSSPIWRDDAELHQVLVQCRWLGVQTAEQAKEMLGEEIVRRSVGKTDLAVLLSAVDHTAVCMRDTLPDALKPLEGEALASAIETRLRFEDFAGELVRDPSWAKMRSRWVQLGWRAATEETFNAAFVRAAAERVAEMRAAPLRDIVLDTELAKRAPSDRAAMEDNFLRRVQAEYDRLPRGGSPRAGAAPQRIDPATPPLEPAAPAEAEPAARFEGPLFADRYSDHELMRFGCILWDRCYARGLTDEQTRDYLVLINKRRGATDGIVLFAAKWAVHAFQRLITSHTFAAALMCSDVQREVLEGIEKQWDAFMVMVPNGMLVAGALEFTRVLVASYRFGAQITLVAPVASDESVQQVVDQADSLPALLESHESDLETGLSSAVTRCLVLAKRLVAGLLLNLQHPPNFKTRTAPARAKTKGREAEPEHRIVTVGKPIAIDCREAVREYIEHGPKRGRRAGPPTVQVMVRGHYRRQVCGVRRLERKVVWISPFWRGPEAALIQTRAARVSARDGKEQSQ
jgi:hypothetical protein